MTATESISSSCCLLAITSVPFSFTNLSTKVFAFGHLHYIGQSSELSVSVKWLSHYPTICPHVFLVICSTYLSLEAAVPSCLPQENQDCQQSASSVCSSAHQPSQSVQSVLTAGPKEGEKEDKLENPLAMQQDNDTLSIR